MCYTVQTSQGRIGTAFRQTCLSAGAMRSQGCGGGRSVERLRDVCPFAQRPCVALCPCAVQSQLRAAALAYALDQAHNTNNSVTTAAAGGSGSGRAATTPPFLSDKAVLIESASAVVPISNRLTVSDL